MMLVYLFCLGIVLVGCNEVYDGGDILDGVSINPFDEDDPHCTHHIHKFYRQMSCQPEMSPDSKCPTSYKCATLQDRNPERCYYGGREYQIGDNITRDTVDFQSPCIESCQCVRMYEGARFYCTQKKKACQSPPPGCRHFNFVQEFTCCEKGVTSCNQGKQDSVKCVHAGRSYDEGEKIITSGDPTCTQCICASGFNGTVAPPHCQELSCVLELWGETPIMLTRGCVPVYLSETGCCPIAYRCPKPTDRVLKAEKKADFASKADKHCKFGNLTMEVGDKLSPWLEARGKPVECSCRIPPIASCIPRNFVFTEEMRRDFAREGLDNTQENP